MFGFIMMASTTITYLSARQETAEDDIGMLWLPPPPTIASSFLGNKRVIPPVVISSCKNSEDDGYETPDLPEELSDTEDDGFSTDEDYCHPYCPCKKTCEERFGAREEELITDDGIYWEKDETKVGKKWWRAPRILHRH